MADILSSGEVVQLGVQIEKNGRGFYADVARRIKKR